MADRSCRPPTSPDRGRFQLLTKPVLRTPIICVATTNREAASSDYVANVRLATLPDKRTYLSGGGIADIRLLLAFPGGELTHAHCPAGGISRPARVYPVAEWFIPLRGSGQLWNGGLGIDSVTDLFPGRAVRIAPGTPIQYRADSEDLDFIVGVLPQWKPQYHGVLREGRWRSTAEGEPASGFDTRGDLRLAEGCGTTVFDVPMQPDYPAPDGSLIYLMGEEPAGGFAFCDLPAGTESTPVHHKQVRELWYVMEGAGQVSRRVPNHSDPVVNDLRPGVCVDIDVGVGFAFRNDTDGTLRLLLLTMPRWPGADEAIAEDPSCLWWPGAHG
jgi:mannose-6-phosphate isomerase-like protein (cupin superfamily)